MVTRNMCCHGHPIRKNYIRHRKHKISMVIMLVQTVYKLFQNHLRCCNSNICYLSHDISKILFRPHIFLLTVRIQHFIEKVGVFIQMKIHQVLIIVFEKCVHCDKATNALYQIFLMLHTKMVLYWVLILYSSVRCLSLDNVYHFECFGSDTTNKRSLFWSIWSCVVVVC